MRMVNNKNYILFWLSQSVSQLGSSMTSFALIIWAYKQTNSAMAVSLLTFFSYLPFILVSLFAGSFVDAHRKKPIMLWADSIAAVCSIAVLILLAYGRLEIWHIYIVNTITGLMNAFQSPAAAVSVGMMVPKEKYARVSGLNSFSSSLITVVTPMLAAFVSSFWGLRGVLFIDMATFVFAFTALLLLIKIPESRKPRESKPSGVLRGCKEGFAFLGQHKGLLYLMLSMAMLNFFSRLTYENILPAMILARSGGQDTVLGIVSGVLGLGGVLGGLIVSIGRLPRSKVKLIYASAAISFLFGDLLMGLGQSTFVWIVAALAASIPIPFISAGLNVLMYNTIPQEMQGRVFAVRNALQYFTIPLGILLGGALADYVFEPLMANSASPIVAFLQRLVGTGAGSGMAVMFLCTSILGSTAGVFWYRSRKIRQLESTEKS